MIVHFSKVIIENIINDESTVYAQIPFINNSYFDFEHETKHLLSLEIDKEKSIEDGFYYEGYYPFYRHRDLDTFKKLLLS